MEPDIFYGKPPADVCHHDVAAFGGEGPIHDKECVRRHAGVYHGIPFAAAVKSRERVWRQLAGEVDPLFDIICCGGREAGGHPEADKGYLDVAGR